MSQVSRLKIMMRQAQIKNPTKTTKPVWFVAPDRWGWKSPHDIHIQSDERIAFLSKALFLKTPRR